MVLSFGSLTVVVDAVNALQGDSVRDFRLSVLLSNIRKEGVLFIHINSWFLVFGESDSSG